MHAINTDESFDLVIHRVGNSGRQESLYLSKTLTFYDPELTEPLYGFFLKPFKTDEYFQFTEREENPVFHAVKNIFEDPTQLLSNSESIASQLYSVSGNPKTPGGTLLVVFFPDAVMEGEHTKVIGIFKIDDKNPLIKAFPAENNYSLNLETALLLDKMDKGCLIFNQDEENGFTISSFDKGKGEDFGIWADEFLKIRQREDEFYDTENVLNLCRSYVMDQMPEEFEVNRVDQADLLNKSVDFFKENETFRIDDFTDHVLQQEELKQSFENYKQRYEDVYETEVSKQFDISKGAVKKNARFFKSIIKLDKNFHIYVHGNRNMIEQGTDEQGKKYYKLYYDSEN
ncbi:MAG: nucleoid-associated protein [Weeksellaceae bacterium]